MNPEAALSLISQYERLLNTHSVAPVERKREKPAGRLEAFGHALSMLPQMRTLLIMGERERFSRWLGFVQGIFFAYAVFTVEEMKEQNILIFKGSSDEFGQHGSS